MIKSVFALSLSLAASVSESVAYDKFGFEEPSNITSLIGHVNCEMLSEEINSSIKNEYTDKLRVKYKIEEPYNCYLMVHTDVDFKDLSMSSDQNIRRIQYEEVLAVLEESNREYDRKIAKILTSDNTYEGMGVTKSIRLDLINSKKEDDYYLDKNYEIVSFFDAHSNSFIQGSVKSIDEFVNGFNYPTLNSGVDTCLAIEKKVGSNTIPALVKTLSLNIFGDECVFSRNIEWNVSDIVNDFPKDINSLNEEISEYLARAKRSQYSTIKKDKEYLLRAISELPIDVEQLKLSYKYSMKNEGLGENNIVTTRIPKQKIFEFYFDREEELFVPK